MPNPIRPEVTGCTVEVGHVLSVGHGTCHWRNVRVTEVTERVAYGASKAARVKYHDGTEDVILAGEYRVRAEDDAKLGVVLAWMTVPA